MDGSAHGRKGANQFTIIAPGHPSGTAFLATADVRQWHMPRLTIFCHTGPPSQNSWAKTWRCHFTLGTPISKSSQPSWTAPSAPTCAWSSGRRRSSNFYDYYGL
eukprot:scaffold5092_cov58-Phaeocystis_antarctica.AAC.1